MTGSDPAPEVAEGRGDGTRDATRAVEGPPDGTAPHLVVADIDEPVVGADAFHHLARVRRLRPGAPVTVTDGHGRWRTVVFAGAVELEVTGPVTVTDRPGPEVSVAFALTKGVKPDWTVQKLTELGVDRIVPFRAERSVVQWDSAKAVANRVRMEGIVVAAVEQSHRVWVPVVEDVCGVDDLAARGAVRADRGGAPVGAGQNFIAVGPEGGWSDVERARLPDSVGLGDHVLRAETAAITAGTVLCTIRSGLVRPIMDPRG